MVTPSLLWGAHVNAQPSLLWRNSSWCPPWTCLGTAWGHSLSSGHWLPGRRGQLPPDYSPFQVPLLSHTWGYPQETQVIVLGGAMQWQIWGFVGKLLILEAVEIWFSKNITGRVSTLISIFWGRFTQLQLMVWLNTLLTPRAGPCWEQHHCPKMRSASRRGTAGRERKGPFCSCSYLQCAIPCSSHLLCPCKVPAWQLLQNPLTDRNTTDPVSKLGSIKMSAQLNRHTSNTAAGQLRF